MLKNSEPQEVIDHQLTHSFYYFYKCGICPQLFQHCNAQEHYQQFHINTAFQVKNLIKLPVPVKLHTEQVDYAIMNPDRRPFDQHYMCRVCPYACAQRGMMKNHQMTHADYREGSLQIGLQNWLKIKTRWFFLCSQHTNNTLKWLFKFNKSFAGVLKDPSLLQLQVLHVRPLVQK